MKRKKTKARPARIPAKPLPISVDEAADKFGVPRAAIEIAQQLCELPRVLTLTALIKWRARREA
jgi:hypothetical protein